MSGGAIEVRTTDYHTAGEPFRIVGEGVVDIPGDDIRARREHAAGSEAVERVRRLLCHEPRGHADMYGCFLVPPDDDGADFGVLFWHKDGYSTACGHGTIALGAWAVESGRVAAPEDGEAEVTIDVPSGRVVARVRRVAGAVESVTFRNVPSYVVARGVAAGDVAVDVAYGGAIYAFAPAERFGLRVVPGDLPALIAAGREVKRALAGSEVARHPDDDRLSGIYGTVLHEELGPLHQRNVAIFADGEVDRSPTGSATSARTALLAADGDARRGSDVAQRLDRRHELPGARDRRDAGRAADRGRGDGVPHRRAPLPPRSARPARHRLRPAMSLPFIAADEVERRLGAARAVDALEAALLAGLDPEADPPRGVMELDRGQLLVMPSAAGGQPVVKLVTVGGEPRVQGVCVIFDGTTLAPVAVADGIAVTNVRTAAVSALAVRHLAVPDARRLLVFGRGPQAHAHVAAMRAVRPIEHVDMLGREAGGRDELVAAADIVCCCTTARAPLFDGALVADHATVVAIGSHEPDVRETDDALAARATVVVESRASALREAGDVILAIESGAVRADGLVPLADLVRGASRPAVGRPRLFKSTGMAWEDAVVAAALTDAAAPR